jgi:UMF1 family MFS transporter
MTNPAFDSEESAPQLQLGSNSLGLVSWATYDWASSAFATLIQTFVFAAYFTRQVAENATIGSAQWGTMVGLAGLVVAIGGPVLGAVADQSGRRKPWVAAFTFVCVAATALLWFVKPSQAYVWAALILVGIGTIGEEYGAIFYNAMLPSLVQPDRVGRWSGWGWSLGYAGGLVCLVVALLAFITSDHPWLGLDRSSAEHVRATFVLTAAWFFLFSFPLLLATPDTPSTGKRLLRAACDGIEQLADSIRRVRNYKHIIRFLIARMIYIDGLTTIFVFGGVYAAGTFDMTEQQVLIFGIALNVTAGLGAAGFAWVDDWIGGKRTILLSLVGLAVPAAFMLLVKSSVSFWILGMILGVFVGPVQAASRSFLARIAPEALRNQMFGLFALSGKATSFIGPMAVGWVTYATGSQRMGMAAIVVLLIIGGIIMLGVPEARSQKE